MGDGRNTDGPTSCDEKLNFLWHLKNLDEASLAKEIFQVQKEYKLPGLVSECLQWIRILNLPNILKDKAIFVGGLVNNLIKQNHPNYGWFWFSGISIDK